MSKAALSHQTLVNALGFDPGQGDVIRHSPADTTHKVVSRVQLRDDVLSIQTQADGSGGEVDMLNMTMAWRGNEWIIKQQAHSGIVVEPDATLAVEAIEHNMAATPVYKTPRKNFQP